MGKILILSGLFLVLAGVLVMISPHVPFLGKLPGDIHIRGRNYSVHFPIITCIIISVLLTIIINLFLRR